MTFDRSAGAAYQISIEIDGGRRLLGEPGNATLFVRILGRLRRRLGFRLHAYVILPDRARMILGTHDGHPRTVSIIIQRLKSRFAREVNTRIGRSGIVWADGFESIRLRSPEVLRRRVDLLHRHPIIARLARDPRGWPWSSYRAWNGEGESPLRIDLPEGVLLPLSE